MSYLLHLLPISMGWLIWYPIAYFFMYNAYPRTGQLETFVLVGIVSAYIKRLSIFLLGRIDRVLNPAVSIVFKALSIAAVFRVVGLFLLSRKKGHWLWRYRSCA